MPVAHPLQTHLCQCWNSQPSLLSYQLHRYTQSLAELLPPQIQLPLATYTILIPHLHRHNLPVLSLLHRQ
uniref:Uncharacterized protein n=1 Tax=Rhizophora mucronata TaxID=61149 RepID=A0A2P2LDE7_RHIMU